MRDGAAGSSPPPPGLQWLVPLALDCKGEDQHKGKHRNPLAKEHLETSSGPNSTVQIEMIAQGRAGLVPAGGEPLVRGKGPWGGLSSVLVHVGGEKPEVHLPLVEDAALVAPGPNLPALGRSLRHPKAPQKTEGTYAQAHTFLLSPHTGFPGNPRAASTWAVSRDKLPVGHVDHELQSQHSLPCEARRQDNGFGHFSISPAPGNASTVPIGNSSPLATQDTSPAPDSNHSHKGVEVLCNTEEQHPKRLLPGNAACHTLLVFPSCSAPHCGPQARYRGHQEVVPYLEPAGSKDISIKEAAGGKMSSEAATEENTKTTIHYLKKLLGRTVQVSQSAEPNFGQK
ncbi:hypothetical protein IHE44_0008931 [Lamprotornis superbus]|uniref:Uncharacterized protein n=1 Tax=Lamprotornis superbus TaxID=245042 RepID=A0A835TXP0_9PASS|nr:hypothetical protein IHE44_0008931 [Lamprotornis superbus]